MMELRPYQNEAVAAVFKDWRQEGRRRVLIVLPTGCGKTIVFSAIIRKAVEEEGLRALVIAHREELLQQAHDKLLNAAEIDSVFEKAEKTSLGTDAKVVIGSVQTLCRDSRLSKFSPDAFDVIVVDEAHHVLADTYQKVLAHFPDARVLGVTATPDRSDHKDLAKFFDNTSYAYGLAKAVRAGYLVRPVAKQLPVKIDISRVKIQNGDFSDSGLDEALDPYLEEIAGIMKTECAGRRTVAFLPLVATAKRFRDCLAAVGMKAAEVDGESEDRQEILSAFDKGKYDVLCNAMLLTEGWDCPPVDCVVVLRPTRSRALYVQMVGRGMRPSKKTGKKDLLLLDFLWLSEKHNLCHPSAIVAKNEKIAQKIDKAQENGELVDILDEEKKAGESVLEEREQALASSIRANNTRKAKTIDLVEAASVLDSPDLADYEPVYAWESAEPTAKQLETLQRMGIAPDGIKSKGQASKYLDLLISRNRAGLCSVGQARGLKRYHFSNTETWSREDASLMYDVLKSNNWKPLRFMYPLEEFNPANWDLKGYLNRIGFKRKSTDNGGHEGT